MDLLCARPCAMSWVCRYGCNGVLVFRELLRWSVEEVAYTEALKNHSAKSHTQGQLQNTCRLEKDVKDSHQDQNDQVNIIYSSVSATRAYKAGVPNLQPVLVHGLLEMGCTAGGEHRVSKQSFNCICNRFPVLASPP